MNCKTFRRLLYCITNLKISVTYDEEVNKATGHFNTNV